MNLRYNIHDVGGEVVKDNETYLLKDNKTLNNLVLSSTKLYRGQSTRGRRQRTKSHADDDHR